MPVTGWERLTAKSGNSFLTCLLLSSDSLTVLPTAPAASSPLVQTLPTHSASTSLLSDRLTPGMELCRGPVCAGSQPQQPERVGPSAPRAATTLCSVEEEGAESGLPELLVTVICSCRDPIIILPTAPAPASVSTPKLVGHLLQLDCKYFALK